MLSGNHGDGVGGSQCVTWKVMKKLVWREKVWREKVVYGLDLENIFEEYNVNKTKYFIRVMRVMQLRSKYVIIQKYN